MTIKYINIFHKCNCKLGYASGGLVQKCLPNPETGVVEILEIEYVHLTSSSMMHTHKLQHATRLKQNKISFS